MDILFDNLMTKALALEVITVEESGFIVALIEKFRIELYRKNKALNILQGEVDQLKENEKIIIDLLLNLISVKELSINNHHEV